MGKSVGRHGFVHVSILFLVSVLVLAVAAKPIGLTLESVQTWYWAGNTEILSVAIGNVDGDDADEIITGGNYYDGAGYISQLCVWDAETLALENVTTWYWISDTQISSIPTADVDGDGGTEIVTGGHYWDGARDIAQLCIWNGATLTLENVTTWYWTDSTSITSVVVGNVDGDGQTEIISVGSFEDGTRGVAQLCVWAVPP